MPGENQRQPRLDSMNPSPVPATPLTPALVRQVAEKVYALWLRDLQLERERLGGPHQLNQRGGRR